ncbi:MAG: 16S rRNA (guanine(966)-N(2))-methyltransferase RsmD [Actinomycetota bacterium]
MRIVAGELRGRRISAPAGNSTRPTTEMAREAIFNALNSMGVVDGARVLDLFAGSGALGIEALSRGAAHCTFIESDREALRILQENLKNLGLTDRATVVRGDAKAGLVKYHEIDFVLADPPYDFTDWKQILDQVSADLVVAESDREIVAIEGWQSLRTKRYGRTHVTYLRRVP